MLSYPKKNPIKIFIQKLRTANGLIRAILSQKYLEKILYSYSQYGEDLVLDKLLANKQSGVYVDIGANDPNILSNTKKFYLKGWRGVNVEPDSTNFQKLLIHRSNDKNLNLGAGPYGELIFYKLSADTLSTFSEQTALEAEKSGYKIISKTKIAVKPLKDIIEETLGNTQIDFLSLDVEGFEVSVLKTNDWSRFRPSLIVVEINRNKKEIYDYLLDQNYKEIYTNGTNAIFADLSFR